MAALVPEMNVRAEDACQDLASAILAGEPDGRRLTEALRRFMYEAKRTPQGAGQP